MEMEREREESKIKGKKLGQKNLNECLTRQLNISPTKKKKKKTKVTMMMIFVALNRAYAQSLTHASIGDVAGRPTRKWGHPATLNVPQVPFRWRIGQFNCLFLQKSAPYENGYIDQNNLVTKMMNWVTLSQSSENWCSYFPSESKRRDIKIIFYSYILNVLNLVVFKVLSDYLF